MKKVAVVVVILGVALVAMISWRIRVQDSALEGPPRAHGTAEAQGSDVSTRWSARVANLRVREGDEVEQGQPLLVLGCAEPEARLSEVRARLVGAQRRAEAMAATVDAQAGQSRAARAAISVSRARIQALETQRALAERQASRVGALGEFATSERQDQASTGAASLAAEAAAARASQSVNRGQAAAAAAQARAAVGQAEATQQEVAAMQAMLETAQAAVDECTLHSPRAGLVDRIYYEHGELVPPGGVVARVVSVSDMRAIVYLPNADLDTARVGDLTHLMADALGDELFEARIIRIGREAEFTPRNIQTRSDRDRLVFPVELQIDDADHRLRSGMPVSARFDSPDRAPETVPQDSDEESR